jgi:hypothetical protein
MSFLGRFQSFREILYSISPLCPGLSGNLPFVAETDSIPGTYVKGENRPKVAVPISSGDGWKILICEIQGGEHMGLVQ